MKRFFLAALCSFAMLTTLGAQETFRKGDQTLSVGVGFGSTSSISLPPLSATYEYGVADNLFDGKGSIGIGGQFEIEQYKILNESLTNFFLGVRGALHYEVIDRLDIYGGLQAGIQRLAFAGYANSSFRVDGVLGARYYLSQTFGLFAEGGTGISTGKVGFTLKF